MPVNRQAFVFLPTLDGANLASEISGDLFPRVEAVFGIVHLAERAPVYRAANRHEKERNSQSFGLFRLRCVSAPLDTCACGRQSRPSDSLENSFHEPSNSSRCSHCRPLRGLCLERSSGVPNPA